MASKERIVDLVIRGKDEASAVLKKVAAEGEKASAAFKAQSRRETIGAATAAIDKEVANYRQLTAEIERQRPAIEALRQSNKLSAEELREVYDRITMLRDRQRESIATIAQQRAAMQKLNASSVSTVGGFLRAVEATERGTVASRLGAAADVRRAAAGKANAAAYREQAVAADAAAQAEKRAATESLRAAAKQQTSHDRLRDTVNDWATAHGRGATTLRPSEISNLMFQVNDVVSGLAMGQNPMMILAQQGGQFIQIFQQAGTTLGVFVKGLASIASGAAAIVLPLAALAAPFLVFQQAAGYVKDLDESTKQFQRSLDLNADGARYNAANMAMMVRQMRDLGISTEQGRAILNRFVKEGLDESKFRGATEAARDLAKATGIEIVDAADKMAGVYAGNLDSIKELDRELNFLTAAQYKQILAMSETGDTAGAAGVAFAALEAKVAPIADKAEGEWAKAFRALGTEWRDFLEFLSASAPYRIAAAGLNLVNGAAKAAVNAVTALLSLVPNQIESLEAQESALEAAIAEAQKFAGSGGIHDLLMGGGEQISDLTAQLEAVRAKIAEIRKENGTDVQSNEAPTEEQLKRQTDFAVKLEEEAQARLRVAEAAGLQGEAQAVFTALQEAENAAKAEGLRIGENGYRLTNAQREALVKSVRAQEQAEAAQDKLNDALKKAEQYTADYATETEKQQRIIAEMEGVIATLTQRFGANHPAVQQVAQAMQRFKAETAMAKAEADALAASAHALTQALASLGSFDADTGRMLATAQNRINMIQQGYSKARIEATEQVTAAINDEVNTMIAAGYSMEEVAARQDELIRQREVALEKTAAAAKLFDEAFNPKKEKEKGKTGGKEKSERELREERINELVKYRQALLEQIEAFETQGDTEAADQLRATLGKVNADLTTSIDNMILFLGTMKGPEIEAAILNLKRLRMEITDNANVITTQFLPTARDLNEGLADVAGDGASAFAQAIANGSSIARSALDALRQSFADLIIEIGRAIVKQAVFNAISGGTGSGGIGGYVAGGIAAIFRHSGGLINDHGSRMIPVSALASAMPRYHSGGLPGLKSNERLTVTEVGEEVITADDPRNVLNGGKRGGQALNAKIVNVLDPADVVAAALADTPGQQVLINHIAQNPGAYRAALGI